eukprot:8708287-Pyramimonas_sp.AAC.1
MGTLFNTNNLQIISAVVVGSFPAIPVDRVPLRHHSLAVKVLATPLGGLSVETCVVRSGERTVSAQGRMVGAPEWTVSAPEWTVSAPERT